MIACASSICLNGICEHSRSFMDNGLRNAKKDKIISLSSLEWNYVKTSIDTNGWCKLPSYSIVVVVTNGLIDVEHALPLFPPMAETYHPDKKTEKIEKEPRPYAFRD